MIRANSEPVTPEVVRAATFSTTRMGRRGLDESEVRAFCDWASDGISRLVNDNSLLQAEVMRLRTRLLEKGRPGVRPEDAHVQAVNLLSRAQEMADRYVAEAQEYSREVAEDARLRRDEVMREARVRAGMILEQAHDSATEAAEAARDRRSQDTEEERQELQTEIAYLRTYSDVCRTHLRAYMESLTRSIEEWERAERGGTAGSRFSGPHAIMGSAPRVLPGNRQAGHLC